MIFEFILPESILANAKKPYDEEVHRALLYSANSLAPTLRENTLVTSTSIFIDFSDNDFPYSSKMLAVGDITASANKWWSKRRVVFDINLDRGKTLKDCQEDVRKFSKAAYELFLENLDQRQMSLFGKSSYVPYEQTPQYFREGVFIE
jgi:hypothetical protein